MPGVPRKSRRGGSFPREGRLARSEVATLRLDPKLQYSLDLASREKRSTISSYLEEIADQSLKEVFLRGRDGSFRSVADLKEHLWDRDPVNRLLKLVREYPDLLNHDEQVRWKLIQDDPVLWPRSREGKLAAEPDVNLIRVYWDQLNAVANREADRSILPGEAQSSKLIPAARNFNSPKK